MSQETLEWLNTQTLIGFTDRRGKAWHYRLEFQGDEPNHYTGPVPLDDVLRRLFDAFEIIEAPVYYKLPNGEFVVSQQGRKGMLRSDTNYDLGAFKSGYTGHAYAEWLLENIATIIDDDLGIGSAGLLRNGAQGWVSVELPDNITTKEGVEFRPNLIATTSFDGSLATTYKLCRTEVVCDNTREMALSEDSPQYKVKHTKNSGYKIHDAREALQIVHTMADDFAKEIADLCAKKVSDEDFLRHLQIMVPIADDTGKAGVTRAERKRAEIINLYNFDERVAPWKGTVYGVTQAYNTWNHHFKGTRKGVPREVRNMENLVNGLTGTADQVTLDTLQAVMA